MKKIIIGIILILCGYSFAWGQGKNREQIEAFRIAFFTKNLSLTSEEAKVFWPVYNAYSADLEEVRLKKGQLQRNVNQELLSSDEGRLESLSNQFIELKRQEINLAEEYHDKFKEVLPIRKVVLLYKAEQKFKQELLKEIQRRRQERMQNGRPGGMRPGIRRRN